MWPKAYCCDHAQIILFLIITLLLLLMHIWQLLYWYKEELFVEGAKKLARATFLRRSKGHGKYISFRKQQNTSTQVWSRSRLYYNLKVYFIHDENYTRTIVVKGVTGESVQWRLHLAFHWTRKNHLTNAAKAVTFRVTAIIIFWNKGR